MPIKQNKGVAVMATTQEKAFQVISYHDACNCIGPSWCAAYVKAKDADQAKHVVIDNISVIAPEMDLTSSSLRALRCEALDESTEFVDGILSPFNDQQYDVLKKAKLVLDVKRPDGFLKFFASNKAIERTPGNLVENPHLIPVPRGLIFFIVE